MSREGPKTLAHSLKLRLVVMMTLVRSYSLLRRWKSNAPPEALSGRYPSSSIARQCMFTCMRGEDHQVGFDERLSDLPGLALGFFLLQCVDQFDGREEAHAFAVMLDGLDAEGGGNMAFPRAEIGSRS